MFFSDILRCLIEDKGITQKKLANDLNIPVSTLGGYVQGTSEPDFQTLKLFSEYFNVSCDYLLDTPGENKLNTKEHQLLKIFRSLTDEQKDIYLLQGKAFTHRKKQ